MSPEAQQAAIATACGWTAVSYTIDGYPYWYDPLGTYRGGGTHNPLPSYLDDHNAMAAARKSLTKAERIAYIEALVDLTGAEWTDSYEEVFTVVDATPAQHAEAFLKAKGLWTEGGETS